MKKIQIRLVLSALLLGLSGAVVAESFDLECTLTSSVLGMVDGKVVYPTLTISINEAERLAVVRGQDSVEDHYIVRADSWIDLAPMNAKDKPTLQIDRRRGTIYQIQYAMLFQPIDKPLSIPIGDCKRTRRLF